MTSKPSNHPTKEQTLIVAKPDALQRGLVGEIIRRFVFRNVRVFDICSRSQRRVLLLF